MPQPTRNPGRRIGHFDRFEVLNLTPGEVVLEFYAAHDPEDSRFPPGGSANHIIPAGGSFLQEPPDLFPVPQVQPQMVECEVRVTQSFIMQVTAPPGQYVGQVVFEVQGENQWQAQTEFRQRD